MKEFVSEVESVIAEDERDQKIAALLAEGKTQEEAEAEVGPPDYIEFKLDDRVMRAYPPNEGQLVFMLAALGRGQAQEQRFASIINIMLESLRPEDADYMESRLLSRDPAKRLPVKTVEKIFEHLAEGWFGGKVTKPASDSAISPPLGGTN